MNIDLLPENWGIQNKDGIIYAVTAPQSSEEKARIVEGYKHFMHCYLVRDCIESFALSLDHFCLSLLLNGKRAQSGKPLFDCLTVEEKQFFDQFEKAGISSRAGKTQLLETRFCIKLPKELSTVISSLKDIRNCFAHGNGFVRQTDGKKAGNNERKFVWNTISVFVQGEETGKIYPIMFGEPFPEDGFVCIKID